jgi:hydroxymethylbilane synthase
MEKLIRIGTRESQLAVWQADLVKDQLKMQGHATELVYIKSEGDLDLSTPLYEMGVQGIFTRALDSALLHHKIDIAVHSMKDVPTQLAYGIAEAAVLKRGSHKDILVYKGDESQILEILNRGTDTRQRNAASPQRTFKIATSSIRRRAQWLNRYPDHVIENLRGNINTRLRKVAESDWQGAIFAAAGLERIQLRPAHSIDLDWMLPAPAQGAIMVACRAEDDRVLEICQSLNDPDTALCTRIERDFLRSLLGGCSTPISALAEVEAGELFFEGNMLSPDGRQKASIERILPIDKAVNIGRDASSELLENGGREIIDIIQHAAK